MTVLLEEIIPGGGHASLIVKRGQSLRLTDLRGDANVSVMMVNAAEKSERLNFPDSLKCQHTAKFTAGHCLYSDMGRVLAAIVADTCGWHDSIGGVTNAQEVVERYGAGRYQELRNAFHRNGTDNLLVEMSKWGLDVSDLMMTLNLFSRIDVTDEGALAFVPGNSKAGDSVELYAPMNTLVFLTAIQHPLDPNTEYAPTPVKLELSQSHPEVAEICRTACEENVRGSINTERFFL
ncbi:hypothetical protein B0G81_8604 [Paraburkholderia sp. BL6665CI2N2]|uniref:urea amidolyase associated protein UAAP1 n=1 Tax=Paraburkholderia sp. BL6665CI2N2 TaxID=1938806 RepID=UPI0010660ED6|nr:urea amidolyase associated protein UAAP1 [Paraburkholderia sp. BL6665CI2N2]TDY15545.1 hypothetical protein B0G81_8604 [Paraburkholderia sp. BL6665CI2N2]